MMRILLLSLWSTSLAYGALPARVLENTPLLKGPDSDSAQLEVLDTGRALAIGNRPVGAFYKARTRSGRIGFVQASALRIYGRSASTSTATQGDGSEVQEEKSTLDWPWVFRATAFAGGLFFNASTINQSLEIESGGVKNSLQVGLDLTVRIHRMIRLLARGEYIFKNVLLQGETENYGIYLRTLPVQVGIGFELLRAERARISLLGMGGMGLGTVFSSTALDQAGANVTEFRAYPIAAQGALEVDFTIWKKLHLVLEGGYRYLRASSLKSTLTGVGSSVFTSNFDINLSGPYVMGGISLTL